jgi:thiamine-monophosphate kinase
LTFCPSKMPKKGEFKFIEGLVDSDQKLHANHQIQTLIGIGDDAAIVNSHGSMVAATDMLLENVHFRTDWSSPEQWVHKAFLRNISDFNAMGAQAEKVLMVLCLNQSWNQDYRSRIQEQIKKCAKQYSVELIGGDTSMGVVGFMALTVLGTIGNNPILRKNAQVGQNIYMTGTLGKSRAGYEALKNNWTGFEDLVDYHLEPTLCGWVGGDLARSGELVAGMDISDGIAQELEHIALQSNVKLVIDVETLPCVESVRQVALAKGVALEDFLLEAGEEYELLFTLSPDNGILKEITVKYPITCIGRVAEGSGVHYFLHGKLMPRQLFSGYTHF